MLTWPLVLKQVVFIVAKQIAILEQEGESTPQQEKLHTTIKGMTPLSKSLFSDIQSDSESYLDSYVQF